MREWLVIEHSAANYVFASDEMRANPIGDYPAVDLPGAQSYFALEQAALTILLAVGLLWLSAGMAWASGEAIQPPPPKPIICEGPGTGVRNSNAEIRAMPFPEQVQVHDVTGKILSSEKKGWKTGTIQRQLLRLYRLVRFMKVASSKNKSPRLSMAEPAINLALNAGALSRISRIDRNLQISPCWSHHLQKGENVGALGIAQNPLSEQRCEHAGNNQTIRQIRNGIVSDCGFAPELMRPLVLLGLSTGCILLLWCGLVLISRGNILLGAPSVLAAAYVAGCAIYLPLAGVDAASIGSVIRFVGWN